MRYLLPLVLSAVYSLASGKSAPRVHVVDTNGHGETDEALDASLSTSRRLFFPDANCTDSDKNSNYNIELRFPGMVDASFGYPTGPDPMCAAGLGSVIGVTMLNIEIRDKGGGPIDVKTLRDFFKILNPPRRYVFQDPKIIYDSYLDLFIVMATLTDKKTFTDIYLAVSSTPEPFRATVDKDEGFWNWYYIILRVNEDGSEVIKYPGISVEAVAIYITGGMYIKSRKPQFN
jgi:hypothetical protein